MHGEERPHAEASDFLQPGIDLGLVALGNVIVLPAAQDPRDLDAFHDGQLPLVNRAPGLERVRHDPEPSLSGAAGLGVDVVLERVQVAALDVDARHVVARVVLLGHHRAERLVVDELGDHHPHPGLPRPLDGGVVVALLGEPRWARPLAEGRPPVHVARPGRPAEVQERLDRAVGPLLVRGAVGGERRRSAERVPRPSAMPVAAEELERGHVRVTFHGAAHGGPWARTAGRRAGGVDVRLGIRRAPLCRDEPDGQRRLGRQVGDREPAASCPEHPPFRRRARRALARKRSGALVGHVLVARPVEQIDPKRGGLHLERAYRRRDRTTGCSPRVQPVAAMNQRIPGKHASVRRPVNDARC